MSEARACSLGALGMVNALGSSCDEIWPRLLAGDQSRLAPRKDLVPGRELIVGEVAGALPEIPAALHQYACRNNALALAALRQIEGAVEGATRRFGPARVAVVAGSSTSGVSDAEQSIRHRERTGSLRREFDYAQLEFGGLAGFVAAQLGIRGPSYALSTACSSGARALASARSLLALGICDAVVAGACDSLSSLTTGGFSALQAVSHQITNPCSRNRSGLTLGEGAAFFLLTRDPGGVQLLGVGESSEAHHMSAPDPSGAGAESAMRSALSDAGLQPEAISYLNLHGTGTPKNDQMECRAVDRVFGAELARSSTKPLVGHTLGAAGATEAGFCWMMLRSVENGEIGVAPHCWDGATDPELPPQHLARQGERVAVGARGAVMSNSFGFGGNNCVLVLGGPGA